MISNCFIWAHWRERELVRQWAAAGYPEDRVPAIIRRHSRLAPRWVPHWIVGWWHYETGTMTETESFVPDDKRRLPWWRAWRAIVFKGHVKRGDLRE